MDYNFSWPLVPINSRLQLARNIAAVDVLREISDTVKDDAVVMYLICCDNSGLRECVMRDLNRSVDDGYRSAVTCKKDTALNIPNGLRKMAYDYGMTTLRQELRSILWLRGIDSDSWSSRIVALPKAIRDVLDSARITNEAEIVDHRPVIDSLRAVVINEAFTISNDKMTKPYSRRQDEAWKKYGFDAATPRQMDTICRLRSICSRTISAFELQRKLPSKFVWDALCNLLDVLLVLSFSEGYVAASNIFTIHEYAKMAEVGHERSGKFDEVFYEINHQRSLRTSSIDRTVDLCSKLSPLAAFMTGRNGRLSFLDMYGDCDSECLPLWRYEQSILKQYLTSLFPSTSTAVKLFMKHEIAIQRIKLRHVAYYAKRYAEKNGTANHSFGCGGDERCEDAPCEVGCC